MEGVLQATSNTLWAFAKLGYCPCKALLEAGARQMLQDLSKSVPQVCHRLPPPPLPTKPLFSGKHASGASQASMQAVHLRAD